MRFAAPKNCPSKKYERALKEICSLFDAWNTGKISVFLDDESCVYDDDAYMLNDLLANVRNIALAALGRPELVPGIPEQSFTVIVPTDLQQSLEYVGYEEEPEVY